jgi:signal transduction histidine kinase
VQVDVADSGCGIDAADRRHVFDAFYRGRAAHESQTSGSGLGLSLVRIVVEAHRGTVEVSSTPGEGSVFSVHLPAIDRAALEDSPEADA